MGVRSRAQPRRRADRRGLGDVEPRVPAPRRRRRGLAGHVHGRSVRGRPPEDDRRRLRDRPRPGRRGRPLGRRPPRAVARGPRLRPALRSCRPRALRSGFTVWSPSPASRTWSGPPLARSAATRSRVSSAVRPRTVPDRVAAASPVHLVPLGVPQRLVCGALDGIVPLEQARGYEEAARAKGDDVTVTVVESAGHFELVDPASVAWPAVRDAVASLLERPRGTR